MFSAVNDFLDDLRGGKMAEAPLVKVEQGELQGKVVPSPDGRHYFSFQGIPYAKPPLGSLRFKAPQPAESWEGIRDASAEGNVSAQIDPIIYKEYIGDENCLFLNVYTPNLDGEFLPVMIFIHGGGYKFGSGNSSLYGPEYLVERDVVVVTINYRCGALGFLCLNTPEVPGNAGLKDMVQAIRWVKDNIHNFGGNAGNITLFGESAGGAAVSTLTASPLSKNLISKAIVQSGTALNSWSFQKNPVENAKTLVRVLGSEAEDLDEVLDFLSATSVRDIVHACDQLQPHNVFLEKGTNLFAPVVEKEFPGVEAALTESFADILSSGRTSNIPIMIGSTALEFTAEPSGDDLQNFIPKDFNLEKNSEEAIQIADQIKKLYFKSAHIGVENLTEYYQLLSDKLINIDTHRYVKFLVQVSKKPIFFYKFNYVGELNISKKLLDGLALKHAAHGDELGYLFSSNLTKDVTPTSQDIKMRERMLRLWTNFAKTGNPTPEENHYITVTWLPVTTENIYYLNINEQLSIDANPDNEKMKFWESLYNKYYKIWEHPSVNKEPTPERAIIVETAIETVVDKNDEPVITTTEITITEAEPILNPDEDVADAVEEVAPAAANIVETIPEDTVPTEVLTEEVKEAIPETIVEEKVAPAIIDEVKATESVQNGNTEPITANGSIKKSTRTSNEIKMVGNSNGGVPKDVIRANDPPEDDLPKNIGVNKFVNFFESLGGKK